MTVRSASDDAQPHDAPAVATGGRGPRRVSNVNTTDIRGAIELGARAMARCFNADDDDLPFMYSRLWPDGWFGFSPWHCAVQVSGRHLESMLRAAEVTGAPVDEEAIAKHTRGALFSFTGRVPLPCNRREMGGPLVEVDEHSIREGFHGLSALVRHRGNDQAAELAERCIAAIREFWSPERGWDLASLNRRSGLDFQARPTFVEGVGRAIGPLVKYVRTTGSVAALELAQTLKDHALDKFFLPDGSYETERFGAHGHSTTCVMSSLAQLADLTDDAALLERVRTFYDRGLWTIRDEIGWVMERSDAGRNPDQGELNNTGDMLETALILARRGYPSYYDDAEQMLRAHILPSQFRDTSFTGPPPEPDDSDARRDVADRALGMFGFCAPYAHRPIGIPEVAPSWDIVAGTTGSLCEAFADAVRRDSDVTRVNLWFDRHTADALVESKYAEGILQVTPLRGGPVAIRIPDWLNLDDIEVEPAGLERRFAGGYLEFPSPTPNQTITLHASLPTRELVLNHRTRDIRVRLRGAAVEAMDSFGTDFTYFDPLD
ncbi:MAG: hypothetical protein OXF96_05240 [Chloroflexi bacterium]|nr:hypothetical protein [Chloroflexota bacterium]